MYCLWIGPSESISLHTKETNDDATVSAIVYEVIQDDEESAPQEVKLKQNVPYKEKVSQKVLVKIIRIINGTVIPLGSTSNNSDDADIDKKNADG